VRRIVCAVLAASLVLALMPGAATGKRHRRPPPQKEQGTILMPAPWTDDTGCFAGLHRRVGIMTGRANDGWVGAHFDVARRTWNRNFVLEVTGGSGYVDLDIYFYLGGWGTPEDVITDPGQAGAPPSVSFNTREEGGEAGKVPEGARSVIICMYGGGRGMGFDASWEYRAGRGVRLPRK
jgi:hypothetical protein